MGPVRSTSDVPGPGPAPGRDDSFRPSRGLRAAFAWLVVCLLGFLWWASGYRAPVEPVAEWQFAHFGRYYPSLTVGLIVLVLALPILALVAWRRRHLRRRHDGERARPAGPRLLMVRAIRSAERGEFFFAGLAFVAALVALGVFVSMLWLPSGEGPVRTVAGVEGSVQPEGAAAYARPFRTGRVARIIENVGVARRVMYVAPVYLARQRGGNGFLTTVDPSPAPPLSFTPIARGVLVERGLPRELQELYRLAGVPVPDRAYLLMRDGATVRWRPLVLGTQVGLLALLTLLVALLYNRQARRLRRVLAEDASPTAA